MAAQGDAAANVGCFSAFGSAVQRAGQGQRCCSMHAHRYFLLCKPGWSTARLLPGACRVLGRWRACQLPRRLPQSAGLLPRYAALASRLVYSRGA